MFNFIKSHKIKILMTIVTVVTLLNSIPMITKAADTADNEKPVITPLPISKVSGSQRYAGELLLGEKPSFKLTDNVKVKKVFYTWNKNIEPGKYQKMVCEFTNLPTSVVWTVPEVPNELGLHELTLYVSDGANASSEINIPYYIVNSLSGEDDTDEPELVAFPQNGTTKVGQELTIKFQDKTDIYYIAYKVVRQYNDNYVVDSTKVYKPENGTITFNAPTETGTWYVQWYAYDGTKNQSNAWWVRLNVKNDIEAPEITPSEEEMEDVFIDVSKDGKYVDNGEISEEKYNQMLEDLKNGVTAFDKADNQNVDIDIDITDVKNAVNEAKESQTYRDADITYSAKDSEENEAKAKRKAHIVDYTDLTGLIEQAQNMLDSLVETDYEEEAWQALKQAKEASSTMKENNKSTQAEIEAQEETLRQAVENLPKQNKEIEQEALQALQDKLNNELHKEDYTKESWKAVQDKIEEATSKELQSEFDKAVQEVESQIQSLEKITPEIKELEEIPQITIETETNNVKGDINYLVKGNQITVNFETNTTIDTNQTVIKVNDKIVTPEISVVTENYENEEYKYSFTYTFNEEDNEGVIKCAITPKKTVEEEPLTGAEKVKDTTNTEKMYFDKSAPVIEFEDGKDSDVEIYVGDEKPFSKEDVKVVGENSEFDGVTINEPTSMPEFNNNVPNVYEVSYTATDRAGQTSEILTKQVTVKDYVRQIKIKNADSQDYTYSKELTLDLKNIQVEVTFASNMQTEEYTLAQLLENSTQNELLNNKFSMEQRTFEDFEGGISAKEYTFTLKYTDKIGEENDKSQDVTFTITVKKATPVLSDLEYTSPEELSKTYDTTPFVVNASAKTEGIGDVTVEYYPQAGEGEKQDSAIDADTYKVKAKVAGGDNYNPAEIDLCDITINKATINSDNKDEYLKYDNIEDVEWDNQEHGVTAKLNAKYRGVELEETEDYTINSDMKDKINVKYKFTGINQDVEQQIRENPKELGKYEVLVDILDGAKNFEASNEISLGSFEIKDTTGPTIELKDETEIVIDVSEEDASFKDPGATFKDNHDGEREITAKQESIEEVERRIQEKVTGSYDVEYEDKDTSGNAASKTRTIYIVDYTELKAEVQKLEELKASDYSNYEDLQVSEKIEEVQGIISGKTEKDQSNVEQKVQELKDLIQSLTLKTPVISDIQVTVEDLGEEHEYEGKKYVKASSDITLKVTFTSDVEITGISDIIINGKQVTVEELQTEEGQYKYSFTTTTESMNVDGNISGTMKLTRTVTIDQENTKTAITENISISSSDIILDTKAPELKFVDEKDTIVIYLNDNAAKESFTSSDVTTIDSEVKYDVQVTNNINVAESNDLESAYTVTYKATDIAGNTSSQLTRNVIVKDYITEITINEKTKKDYKYQEKVNKENIIVDITKASGESEQGVSLNTLDVKGTYFTGAVTITVQDVDVLDTVTNTLGEKTLNISYKDTIKSEYSKNAKREYSKEVTGVTTNINVTRDIELIVTGPTSSKYDEAIDLTGENVKYTITEQDGPRPTREELTFTLHSDSKPEMEEKSQYAAKELAQGTYKIKVTCSNPNYNINYTEVEYTVNKATLTKDYFELTEESQSKITTTYDAVSHKEDIKVQAKSSMSLGSVTVTEIYYKNGEKQEDVIDAGTYNIKIAVTLNENENYENITDENPLDTDFTLTIEPLTVGESNKAECLVYTIPEESQNYEMEKAHDVEVTLNDKYSRDTDKVTITTVYVKEGQEPAQELEHAVEAGTYTVKAKITDNRAGSGDNNFTDTTVTLGTLNIIDFTELDSLIESTKDLGVKDDYTEGWENFESAKQDAENAKSNQKITQKEIEQLEQNLESAIENLNSHKNEVDREKLNEFKEKYKKEDYTEKSWTNSGLDGLISQAGSADLQSKFDSLIEQMKEKAEGLKVIDPVAKEITVTVIDGSKEENTNKEQDEDGKYYAKVGDKLEVIFGVDTPIELSGQKFNINGKEREISDLQVAEGTGKYNYKFTYTFAQEDLETEVGGGFIKYAIKLTKTVNGTAYPKAENPEIGASTSENVIFDKTAPVVDFKADAGLTIEGKTAKVDVTVDSEHDNTASKNVTVQDNYLKDAENVDNTVTITVKEVVEAENKQDAEFTTKTPGKIFEITYTAFDKAGNTAEVVKTVTIIKHKIDLSSIGFNNKPDEVYDGSYHTITVTGALPAGLSEEVNYTYSKAEGAEVENSTNKGVIDPGTYTVTATFSEDTSGKYEITGEKTKTATLTIRKAQLTFTVKNNTYVYDTTAKTATITPNYVKRQDNAVDDISENITTKYYQTGTESEVQSPTKAGVYDIKVTVSENNKYEYTAPEEDGKLKEKLTINKVAMTDTTDGDQNKTIYLSDCYINKIIEKDSKSEEKSTVQVSLKEPYDNEQETSITLTYRKQDAELEEVDFANALKTKGIYTIYAEVVGENFEEGHKVTVRKT